MNTMWTNEGYKNISPYYTKLEVDEKLKNVSENSAKLVDLTNYYTKQEIDGKNFLTLHLDLSEYAKKVDIPSDYLTDDDLPTKVSLFENDKNYITEHLDITGKVDKVEGKDLSTNDYTDEDKDKVDNLIVTGSGSKYLSDDGTYKTIQTGGGGSFIDAPTDGKQYVRKDGEWVENIDTNEYLNVVLVDNHGSDTSLIGQTVTVLDETKEYQGSSISFKLQPNIEYTVIALGILNDGIFGYKTPDPKTFTSDAINIRNVEMVYQSELLSLTINNNSDTSFYEEGCIPVIVIHDGNFDWDNLESLSPHYMYQVPEELLDTNSVHIDLQCHIISGSSYVLEVKLLSEGDYLYFTNPKSFVASTTVREISLTREALMSNPIDLSMVDIYNQGLTGQTSANCYVVSTMGAYKFPIAYGAAIKNGAINSEAYTENEKEDNRIANFVNALGNPISSPYVEIDTGKTLASALLSLTDVDKVFSDISIVEGANCKYIQFAVNKVPKTGANGIISVLDSDGTILWNWHIWVWGDDLSTVTITNNSGELYKILPVNLASTWDDATKTHIKNWHYQCGRNIPIVGPRLYNNGNAVVTTYGALSFTSADTAASYEESIKNPTTFYKGNSTSNNNWFGTVGHYNLWDADRINDGHSDNLIKKTVYDPCPVGFHIPNGNIFTGFSKDNVVGAWANGWYFKKNAEDTVGIFFPASGYRAIDTGALAHVGSSGRVWSAASYSSTHAYYLYFYSGTVGPLYYSSRANGFSVRPVAES